MTALHLTIGSGALEIARLLIERGANVHMLDKVVAFDYNMC